MSAVASQWHWMDRGRKMGPVSWGELQALAKSGKLRPTDMVLRDGSTKWQPAQQARDADETPSQSGATVAPAPVAAMRPPPVPRQEAEFDMNSLSPAGFRPMRLLFGLGLIVAATIATVCGYNDAVARGGGKYTIYTGAFFWGLVLIGTSFRGKYNRYDA